MFGLGGQGRGSGWVGGSRWMSWGGGGGVQVGGVPVGGSGFGGGSGWM